MQEYTYSAYNFLDAIGAPCMVTDTNGRVIATNKKMESTTGVMRDQVRPVRPTAWPMASQDAPIARHTTNHHHQLPLHRALQ